MGQARSDPDNPDLITKAGQLNLSNLPMAELVELQARTFQLIRAKLLDRAQTFKRYVGEIFYVLWYPDDSYFAAKILAVHDDSGLVEVEWVEQDDGYTKRCLVSADCINGRVSDG